MKFIPNTLKRHFSLSPIVLTVEVGSKVSLSFSAMNKQARSHTVVEQGKTMQLQQ